MVEGVSSMVDIILEVMEDVDINDEELFKQLQLVAMNLELEED